jgi:acylphosphatase
METEKARLQAQVHGRVQGVGYRIFVREAARRLGLAGSVRNEEDGSVLVVAEGVRSDLERLLAELHRGPGAARVMRVDAWWSPPAGEPAGRFEVQG